jgi:tetratricopeptide (TPR) repeat protein
MKRISRSQLRKQIRRNEVGEALKHIRQYLGAKRENTVLVVIALVILVGGAYIYRGYQQSVEEEAQVLVLEGTRNFQAMLMAAPGGGDNDRSVLYYQRAVESFSKLSSGYGGEHLSGFARIYLGNSHYYAEEYVKAISEYNNYLQEYPEGIYVGLARKNIAFCHRANGQLSQAASILEELTKELPWGVSLAECQSALIGVYRQMGRITDADTLSAQLLKTSKEEYWTSRQKAK